MPSNRTKPPEIENIEELLRSIQPLPGKSYHRRMESAPWNEIKATHEGDFIMKRTYAIAAALAVLLVILAGFAFTPPGRALADEIIHFFNPAPAPSLPLAPQEILPLEASATPAPTHILTLLPAEAVKPKPTTATPPATPNLDQAQTQDLVSISAKNMVDYPLLAPAYLPRGYRLARIAYDGTHKAISMEYASSSAPEEQKIRIYQEKASTEKAQTPGETSRELQVNGQNAEFSHDCAGAGRPCTSLHWQSGQTAVTLQSFQGFDVDELLKIAASMSSCTEKDYTCQVQQAACAAGFTPWQFPQAPEGLTFNNAYYYPLTTSIWYAGPAGELGVLQSKENFSVRESNVWFSVPQEAIQKVTVAGQAGEYVEGSFISKAGEDHATWNAASGQIRLRWKLGDTWFQIVKWGEPFMQPQELADLAGKLTADANRIDADRQKREPAQTNPDTYSSVSEIRQAAAIPILEPSLLPEDLPFSHARLLPGGGAILFYGDFNAVKNFANGPVLIVIQKPLKESLEEGKSDFEQNYASYPAEAIEEVQVKGEPGRLIRGTLLTDDDVPGQPTPAAHWVEGDGLLTLYWETTHAVNTLIFDPQPGDSGARPTQEDMIKIAESLR